VTQRLTLKLAPLPKHKTLGVVNFTSFYKAMDSAQHIVKLRPTAVELVDRTMIELARANPAFRPVIERALIGIPRPSCLVEFAGEEREAQVRDLARLVELMGDLGLPGSVVEMPESRPQAELWGSRKAGLNIMMSMKGDGKPVSIHRGLRRAAGASGGLHAAAHRRLHQARHAWAPGTRTPRSAPCTCGRYSTCAERVPPKMRAIAEEASAMVREYKGAYSGEHATGWLRSEWVGWQFGPRLTKAFETSRICSTPQAFSIPARSCGPRAWTIAHCSAFKPGHKTIDYKPALDWSAWECPERPDDRGADGAGQRRRFDRRLRQGRRHVQQQRPLPQIPMPARCARPSA